MSEFNITECNWCKSRKNEYCPDGWIEIKKGRFYGPWTDISKKHFCTTECFSEFIDSLSGKVKTQEVIKTPPPINHIYQPKKRGHPPKIKTVEMENQSVVQLLVAPSKENISKTVGNTHFPTNGKRFVCEVCKEDCPAVSECKSCGRMGCIKKCTLAQDECIECKQSDVETVIDN